MPKRSDGNETPTFRAPSFGAASNQVSFDVPGDVTPMAALAEHEYLNAYTLCPNGITPQNVTGIILRMLQLHFSQEDYINRVELRPYVWSDSPAQSKIKIATSTTFNTSQANQLPALIVKRGALQSVRQVIGDHVRANSAAEARGERSFYRAIQGTHFVACAAEADAQAELLAMEVFETMTWASPLMRTVLPFLDFQVVGMSELMLLDALGNKVGVQLQLRYEFEYGWQTTEIAPVLNRISQVIQPTVSG